MTTTSFTSADAHTIYVGSGHKIYTYDLRMESLLLGVDQAAKVYDGAEDEINQVQRTILLINEKERTPCIPALHANMHFFRSM